MRRYNLIGQSTDFSVVASSNLVTANSSPAMIWKRVGVSGCGIV